jgi:hypothetical protein
MSEMEGALASGPESRFVVGALASVLDGHGPAGRDELVAGATATSWAAVLHRVDVAGRALALDAGLTPADAFHCAPHVAAFAAACGVNPLPAGTGATLEAWCRGDGVPVAIDLTTGQLDAEPEMSRAWAAALVLAWLVERSGFPPQVVA